MYRRRSGSPVFFLEPADWVRTQGTSPSPRNSPLLLEGGGGGGGGGRRREGSSPLLLEPTRDTREGTSPLPYRDKLPNPMKLLESLGCGLDVLTESEENLSLEVEELTGGAPQQRTKSDPGVVLRKVEREEEGSRSRSGTPGPAPTRLLERHRKTPIPVLCSRGAWMVPHRPLCRLCCFCTFSFPPSLFSPRWSTRAQAEGLGLSTSPHRRSMEALGLLHPAGGTN